MPKIIAILIKYGRYLILLAVIIILSSLFITQCQNQKLRQDKKESELQAQIKTERAKITAIEATSKALKFKIKEDSLKSIASHAQFVKEIKTLKVKLAQARQPVQVLIDSIPALDNFVDLQDSTINLQDNRIDTLEYEKAEMWAKFNALLSSAEEKNKVQIELNEHYSDLNKQLSKQVKRQRTRKVFWKVTTGILAVGIVGESLGVFD